MDLTLAPDARMHLNLTVLQRKDRSILRIVAAGA